MDPDPATPQRTPLSDQAPLLPEQAQRFHRDGYLRLPQAVAGDQVQAARRFILARLDALRRAATSENADERALAARRTGSSRQSVITDLFNESAARACVESMFESPCVPVRGGQIATKLPSFDEDDTNEAGYLNRDTPHFGWIGHIDGLWNGGTATPAAGVQLTEAQLHQWRSERSTNGGQRTFEGFNQNLSNFCLLVGVALSDQRAIGAGQLGLLRGAHRHMEQFFCRQRDAGGPLGPDGPDWPRENPAAPNGHGLVHYPDFVRRRYRRTSVVGEDGVHWPRPTFMKLRAGDAIIVHHLTPHSASRVLTADPRLMVYFRCTPCSRPAANLDPQVYPEALCDRLLELPGVRRALGNT